LLQDISVGNWQIWFCLEEARMTIIEMDTTEARANSARMAQYLDDLRAIKNEIVNDTATLANNWQSRGCDDFQSLMQDILAELEGKIANLQNLKQSLDTCISANEEVASKLG
jgi:uncharacterized protein YukE